MTADPEPPPGGPACEALYIGIRCIDVMKRLHDAATHRAIKAANVPPCPPGQLDMHGSPPKPDCPVQSLSGVPMQSG